MSSFSIWHWMVVIVLTIPALMLYRLIQRHRQPANLICTACGFQGAPKSHTRGSILIEIILWLAFIIPGLIYSLWRLTTRQQVCPQCQNAAMIPKGSPRGLQLVKEYESKSTA